MTTAKRGQSGRPIKKVEEIMVVQVMYQNARRGFSPEVDLELRLIQSPAWDDD